MSYTGALEALVLDHKGCYEQVEFTIESKNICKKPVKQKIKKSKNDATLLLTFDGFY